MAYSHSCRIHLNPSDVIETAADLSVMVYQPGEDISALQVVVSDPDVAARCAVAFAELAEALRHMEVPA